MNFVMAFSCNSSSSMVQHKIDALGNNFTIGFTSEIKPLKSS